MASPSGYSPMVDRALALAALAHEGKRRKGTLIPYVMHPMHVAMILQRYGYGEPLVIAALLHDVLEDMRFEDIALQARIARTFPGSGLPVDAPADRFRTAFTGFVAREFGEEVLALVQSVSDPKDDERPPRSWRERREHQIAHLERATPEVAALKAADLLHNIRSVTRDVERGGLDAMERFNAGPSESLWYYETAAGLAATRLERSDGLAGEVLDAARALRHTLEQLGVVSHCDRR